MRLKAPFVLLAHVLAFCLSAAAAEAVAEKIEMRSNLWEEAKGEALIEEAAADTREITIRVENLVPDSVFTVWFVNEQPVVDIMGVGVLIEGRPGIGKSEAALALIIRGYSLVADDFTILRRHDDRTIIGASSPVTRYHMELRGLGIIHVPSLFGVASVRDEKNLDLIVTLRKVNELEDQGLGMVPTSRNVLGMAFAAAQLEGLNAVSTVAIFSIASSLRR